MPSLSSNATTYRRGGYSYTGYISVIPQTVVLSGTITAVPSYPATALSYTLTGGAFASATQDLTVNCYSSTGVLKAVLRVASGTTATSTTLPVNEFSSGVYDVTIGDTFQVVREYQIKDRLVSATAALNKDSRIVYGDQGANPNPVCNSGGASPGFSTTRDFYGSTSFVIDPDSAGTINHTWDYIDGSGTTNVANPTGVTFPAGFRWVKHTATDAGNSKSSIQYVPVWVHDDSYPPLRVQMDSLSGTVERGWNANFKLPFEDESSITSLPDGALVCYWEREHYSGAEASYGANVTGRSHVKFIGYLTRDSIFIDPDNNEVTFEAVSPLAILEQTPALPQLMVSDATPANWQELKTLSTQKMFWYLSYWHSSLQTAWDFVWTDGLDLSYSRISVEGSTIAEQLRDIANSLNVQLTCDRLGRLQFVRDPHYLTTVQRSSRTKTYDLTTADVMDIEITREHRGTVKSIRGEGITTANAHVFSNAPGNAPAPFGTSSDTLAKQIVASQTDLNERAGYAFARANGLYNGRFVPKGARVTLPDGYDIFDPAHREFVTLTLPASLNARGISFDTSTRWTVEAVDIGYDIEAGAKTVNLTLDHETSGAAGVTYIPPQEAQNGLGDFPGFDLQFPDLGFDFGAANGLIGGTTTIAIFCGDGNYYITNNFERPAASGGPTYAAVSLTSLGMNGTLLDFVPDAYSPLYIGTGTAVNGWLATTTRIYRITDIFGSTNLTSVHTFASSSSFRQIQSERGVQGWTICISYYSGTGVKAAYTTDSTNFTEVSVTNFADDNAVSAVGLPPIWMSPHTAGKARTIAFTSNGSFTAPATGYQTLDYGATWSQLSDPLYTPNNRLGFHLEIPYSGSDNVAYYGKASWNGTNHIYDLRKSVGTTITDIGPTVSASKYGVQFRRGIRSFDLDANRLMLIGYRTNAPTAEVGVFTSLNGGASWTTVLAPSSANNGLYRGGNIGGDGSSLYIWGDGRIWYSADFGATGLDNRTGNISTSSTFVNICGG